MFSEGEEMNIIEQLIAQGVAKNAFQASHIANGLKLAEMVSDTERIERAKLYRRWRNSKHTPTSAEAYDLAIAGISPDDVLVRQISFELEIA